MQIRQVDPSSLHVLSMLMKLQKDCLPHDYPIFPDDKTYWWVAAEAGLPIGFACLTWSRRWSDTGYLSRAGVIRQARGKGVQKRLIKVRMAKAKRLGMNWLITDTTDNPPSANSLIACGFKMFEPSKPWANKQSLYWRKRID